jgi:K+-sensing histidine kinase KdpD
MLAFNFFFVPPLYTFTIEDTKNWFALLVFVVTAVVVSELASRSRRRAEEAEAAFRALRDLTEERERLAEEVLEAEALRRSDALKTALLRSVSHDLRSPLTAILASADALASPGLMLEPEDRLGLAETIRDEATRLDRVVEQLLDLSRLEAGSAEPHRELWHIDELVGQALAGLGAEAGRVRLEIGSETPPVEVDAAQVERVLANLLDNALKYSPPGSFVLLRAEPGATELRIHVVDSGAGLPESTERRCSSRSAAERPGTAQGSDSRSHAASPRRTAAGSGPRTIRAAGTSSSRCRSRSVGQSSVHHRPRPRGG